MRHKPSFAIVAYSLVGLSAFGFVMDRLRGEIPPRRQNRLGYERSEFLVQGSRSEVDWRPFDKSAFAEARRTGKPIMILIGIPHGKAARDGDDFLFSDREVVSFLNRYMVCIRIDGLTDPRWIGTFLPLQRASLPMLSGFQMWFLTPEGRLYDNAGEIGTTQPIESTTMTQALLAARDSLREIRDGGPLAPVAGAEQATDEAVLTTPATPTGVNFAAFESQIQQGVSLKLGGFPRFDRVALMPNVFDYILQTGRGEDFRRLADAKLATPIVDWLGGGFFRTVTAANPFVIEYDKAAFSNAEMMRVFARASVLLNDPVYRKVAQSTFDCLTTEFVQHGLISGACIGDETSRKRSVRQSFSPARLRDLLTESEREIARSKLGLRVEQNPMMSVWIEHPAEVMNDEACQKVLAKLRAGRAGEVRNAGIRQLDIHGYVVARLLETARVLGDGERLKIADDLFSRLEWFLAGDDVKHTLEPDVPDQPFLGDYLAFADASLQHFLAVGRPESFQNGLRVLLRARYLFETETAGVWQLSLNSKEPLGPQNINVPELLDFLRESCTSQAIRLCNSYGRLLRNPGAAASDVENSAISLNQAAASIVAQFSPFSDRFGLMGASFFCAALKIQDDAHAIAVGPNSMKLAQSLLARAPTRLIAPAIGKVRPDLQKRAPGIYVIRGTSILGPLDVPAAAAQLPSVFRPR